MPCISGAPGRCWPLLPLRRRDRSTASPRAPGRSARSRRFGPCSSRANGGRCGPARRTAGSRRDSRRRPAGTPLALGTVCLKRSRSSIFPPGTPAIAADLDARRALAREIDRTCREIGFIVIAGHGIDAGLIATVEETSRAFFDLPLEEKMRIVRPAPDVTRGYLPLKAEVLVRSRGYDGAGDLNESLMIGPVDVLDTDYYTSIAAGRHFAPNLWPARPAGLRAAYEAYYRAMEVLACDLMRLFALTLDLPERFFDASVDRHISRLRVRNYPAPLV